MNIVEGNLKIRLIVLSIIISLLHGSSIYAFKERTEKNVIEAKEFRIDELYISQATAPIEKVIDKLSNRAVWASFLKQNKAGYANIDPRSGRPMSLTYSYPLIPGTGNNNYITLESLSATLGYTINRINENVVRSAVMQFLIKHANVLNIKIKEIGEIRATNTDGDYLWHVFIRRQLNGIPVRNSNASIVINHGNVILWGVEKWGDISIDLTPLISREQAKEIGFNHIGGRLAQDKIIRAPYLEIVPIAPAWDGTIGKGYDHKLVWTFVFTREGYNNTWEMLVDAHKGKLISFEDLNMYMKKKIVGAIYPLSNDNCAPQGIAYPGTPMIYINTGFSSPNDFTNYGGFYEYTGGTPTTTLTGKYIHVVDSCGAITESAPGANIDLEGANGEHDCTVPAGHSDGDTFAARSAAYEVQQMNRMAASWVNYSWLNDAITCNVNLQDPEALYCNAFWRPYFGDINFFLSGNGCGNTGEIAAIFDHEWAHGLDKHDANHTSSCPGEVTADVLANLRMHNSCSGEGFFIANDKGCGQWTCPYSGQLIGYNCGGFGDCCTDCTGTRDQDYHKHASGQPHTPANFICAYCPYPDPDKKQRPGPCGREEHCENAPGAEAVWDLSSSDLQQPPFSYDKQTAFEIATRLAYLGSAMVTDWYYCTCPSTSCGCGPTNGYMQFISADDDDGNINNGTPHMTAIYNAFNRHEIACTTPPFQNNGCSGGPTTAPTLDYESLSYRVELTWTSVPNAAKYYVMRTEGPFFGCDFGKIKIATVSGTSYADTQVLNNRSYYYQILPVGSNSACLGTFSNCQLAVPHLVPQATHSSSTIIDTCPGGGPGNNNGIIDPGEIITETITIINDGSADLTNLSGVLSTTSPDITIAGDTATFPDILLEQTATSNSPHFAYNVDQSCPCLRTIALNLALSFTQGSNNTDFSKTVGAASTVTLLDEPFVTGNPPTGWQVIDGGSGGGEAATWTTANPGNRSMEVPFALPFEIVDSETAGIGAIQDEQLITPTINASGCNFVTVEFSNLFHMAEGNGSEIADVDVTINDGSSWFNVLRMIDDDGFPNPNTKTIDITSAISSNPSNVKIRFHYYQGNNEYWWAIDNVKVLCTNAVCTICTSNPGKILNTLLVSKSAGTDLNLQWSEPGGTCAVTGYGLYRGTLPWSGYNHASGDCTISGTSTVTPQDSDSYYYLIVPLDSGYEGSYGTDSSSIERPQGSSPCKPQKTTVCN